MSAAPISLDRYKKCVRAVYNVLKDSDGMTAYELEKETGYPRSTIRFALEDNLLFYVDRWKLSRKQYATQVWCAAEMKRYDDCPRPENMNDAHIES